MLLLKILVITYIIASIIIIVFSKKSQQSITNINVLKNMGVPDNELKGELKNPLITIFIVIACLLNLLAIIIILLFTKYWWFALILIGESFISSFFKKIFEKNKPIINKILNHTTSMLNILFLIYINFFNK